MTAPAARPATPWSDPLASVGDPAPAALELAVLKHETRQSVSVVVPLDSRAVGVGPLCRAVSQHLVDDAPLVDRLLVIDCGSSDGLVRAAEQSGAEVLALHALVPEVPVCPGRGEMLWRSLAAVDTDLVVWLDPGSEEQAPEHVVSLLAPLLLGSHVAFVKGYHRPGALAPADRPSQPRDELAELLVRPLLARFFPALTGFSQPLATECAARTEVLRSLPFFTGPSADVGLLIDLEESLGVERLAVAPLGPRSRRPRSSVELSVLAHSITSTILRRAQDYGRLVWTGADEPPGREAAGVTVERQRPAMDLVLATSGEPATKG